MSLMESGLLPLGYALPVFRLRDTQSGRWVSDEDYAHCELLLAIICNHCPYVVHIKEGLAALAKKIGKKGVATVAVSSNDPELSPIDTPEKMALDAHIFGYEFPYLFDEDQTLAKGLRAVCTPEFFLFDKKARLVYRGQMDDARPNNDKENDGRDILAAVSAMQDRAPPVDLQRPSVGCSIKWREGNEPDYVKSRSARR